MPWESTMCISRNWFYNSKDTVFKWVDVLVKDYKITTSQKNILILNAPPTGRGKLGKRILKY